MHITCSPAADLHHCLVCAEQRGHACTGKRPTFITSVTARQAPRWSKALTHPERASSKPSRLDFKASKTQPSQALGTSPGFCLSISAPAIFACSWSCATRSLLRPSPLRSSAAASLRKLSSSSWSSFNVDEDDLAMLTGLQAKNEKRSGQASANSDMKEHS